MLRFSLALHPYVHTPTLLTSQELQPENYPGGYLNLATLQFCAPILSSANIIFPCVSFRVNEAPVNTVFFVRAQDNPTSILVAEKVLPLTLKVVGELSDTTEILKYSTASDMPSTLDFVDVGGIHKSTDEIDVVQVFENGTYEWQKNHDYYRRGLQEILENLAADADSFVYPAVFTNAMQQNRNVTVSFNLDITIASISPSLLPGTYSCQWGQLRHIVPLEAYN